MANGIDYGQKIREAAATTRKVPTIDTTILKAPLTGLQGTYKQVGEAAVTGFQQQEKEQQKRAERAASALEMVGASTVEGIRRLENIQTQIKSQAQKTTESWSAAATKADEYVQAARSRVGEVLSKLDQINDEFSKERSFAKSHAMLASVQAVRGSMAQEEREIIKTYGADSAEAQQFKAAKATTLATVQSNIHNSYQQLAEQQNNTYLAAVSDAYTKSNMYLGFQEQQHAELLRYSEESKSNYSLQAAQLDVSIEQLKGSAMENIANWLIETPTFSMDMLPLVTMLSDLKTTQETEARAAALTGAQTALTSAEARQKQLWTEYMAGERGLYGKNITGRGKSIPSRAKTML